VDETVEIFTRRGCSTRLAAPYKFDAFGNLFLLDADGVPSIATFVHVR
jgi:hypothetical protein